MRGWRSVRYADCLRTAGDVGSRGYSRTVINQVYNLKIGSNRNDI